MVFSYEIVWATTQKAPMRECFKFDIQSDHKIE